MTAPHPELAGTPAARAALAYCMGAISAAAMLLPADYPKRAELVRIVRSIADDAGVTADADFWRRLEGTAAPPRQYAFTETHAHWIRSMARDLEALRDIAAAAPTREKSESMALQLGRMAFLCSAIVRELQL